MEAYREKDPRIRIIHKENGGLSSARNAGVDMGMEWKRLTPCVEYTYDPGFCTHIFSIRA